jgi:hypothetical protein
MINPNPFLATIGWNSDVEDTETVTIIRRQIRYDEVVMTREEFEQMNNNFRTNNDFDEKYERLEELADSMKDIEYTEPVEYYYTAIVGDVTSATDDVIFTAPFEWLDDYDVCNEGISLCEVNAVEAMRSAARAPLL